jgi:uncharacterized protein (TIGR03083 family)
MTSVRSAFGAAAEFAVDLLGNPAVADQWAEPSALAEMSVGALAAHLARQLSNVQLVLAAPAGAEPPIALLEHYARVAWIGAGLQDAPNVVIRRDSEDGAAVGPAALAAAAASAARELREQLATEPADRVVLIPWGPWSLTLDDMLITRIMEIAVHGDDLAYSVGLPDLQLPEAVADIATGLLVRLAVRRHGQAALLRAMARQERAPQSIAAF